MAVSVATNPQIDLFIPQQPLGSGLPIGMWRGITNLAGDGTGGGATIDIETPSAQSASLYMWSIEEISFTDSPTPAASQTLTVTWETGDPCIILGTPSVFILRRAVNVLAHGLATVNAVGGITYGPQKFHYIARPRGFVMRLRAEYANANLHTFQFAAWGFLFHQEYAKSGAAMRPGPT